MKLRIKENSLRLRLSRSEVARLLTGGCLEETIWFAPEASARFSYSLRGDSSVTSPIIQYGENKVAVLVPTNQANTWGGTDQVGIAEDISLAGC